ncbi:MAG TPA: hypothetical protein QGG32_11735 [Rhodospirillales bacterium]|nr:hypothetical protein [Rhodospirillales bacterium]
MRRKKILLEDILEAIGDVEEFVAGLDAHSFAASPQNDRKTFRAVMACLSAIGEAVKGLPDDLWDGPQASIGGASPGFATSSPINFLIHPEAVWKTLTNELSVLKAAVEQELRKFAALPP